VNRPPDTAPTVTDGSAGVRKVPADRQQCAHRRIWWDLAGSDRIVEATTPLLDSEGGRDVAAVDLGLLAHIGAEGRAVLDERGATWQIVEWTLPIVRMVWRDLPPRPTWRDLRPLVDVAVGAALVALRTAIPDPPADPDDRAADEQLRGIVVRGALVGLRHLAEEAAHDLRAAGNLLADKP